MSGMLNTQDLRKLVLKIQAKDKEGFFHHPVQGVDGYYTVIAEPMCFSDILEKVDQKTYTDIMQLRSDFLLITDNATYFNPENTIWHQKAKSLKKTGLKMITQYVTKFEGSASATQILKEKSSNKRRDSTSSAVSTSTRHEKDEDEDPESRNAVGKLNSIGEIRKPGIKHSTLPQVIVDPEGIHSAPTVCALDEMGGRPLQLPTQTVQVQARKKAYHSAEVRKRQKVAKDTRISLGVGILNDFQHQGTAMDCMIVWKREMDLHLSTGLNPNYRQEGHLYHASAGPLFFPDYRPKISNVLGGHPGKTSLDVYKKSLRDFISGCSIPNYVDNHIAKTCELMDGTLEQPNEKGIFRVPENILSEMKFTHRRAYEEKEKISSMDLKLALAGVQKSIAGKEANEANQRHILASHVAEWAQRAQIMETNGIQKQIQPSRRM